VIAASIGLGAGLLAGYLFHVDFSRWDGLYALILFLVLADELAASVLDSDRNPLGGLIYKGVFCGVALIVQRFAGLDALYFTALILIVSVFWRMAHQVRGRTGEGWRNN
jgi:hypothetical protein